MQWMSVLPFFTHLLAGQSLPIMRLEPASEFPIPASQGMLLAQLHTANGSLYFLQRIRRTAQLAKTDAGGRLLRVAPLPEDFFHAVAGENGRIYGMRISRGAARIVEMEETGAIRNEWPAPARTERVGVFGARLFAWGQGMVSLNPIENSGMLQNPSIGESSFGVAIGSDRWALVGGRTRSLHVLASSGELQLQRTLDAPELRQASPPGDTHLPIFSVAADAAGHLYCAVSP